MNFTLQEEEGENHEEEEKGKEEGEGGKKKEEVRQKQYLNEKINKWFTDSLFLIFSLFSVLEDFF